MSHDDMRPKAQQINNERVSGMGRRRFLKALSAAGLTGASASYLTADDVKAAASDEVPIVYAHRHEDPTRPEAGIETKVKYVPADWYNELEHARRVRRSMGLENLDGVVEVGAAPGKYGGRGAHIDVGIAREVARDAGTTFDEVAGRIPTSREGIEIRIREVGMPQLDNCYNSDYGDSVPAGAIAKNSDGAYGTLTGGVYDDGAGPKFTTNQHIYNDVSDDSMFHDDTSNSPVAEIYDSKCNLDYVLGEPANGHSPTQSIAGTNLTINYQYDRNGIDDLIAQDETARKNGVRTCETSGKIVKSGGYIGVVDDGCSDRDFQVKGEWDTNGGDSGSAVYRDMGDGDAGILSMHAGTDPLNGNAFGFGAYHLEDQQNIYWA
jgi:hypothetical protein